MLVYTYALNWEREKEREKDKCTLPLSRPLTTRVYVVA